MRIERQVRKKLIWNQQWASNEKAYHYLMPSEENKNQTKLNYLLKICDIEKVLLSQVTQILKDMPFK